MQGNVGTPMMPSELHAQMSAAQAPLMAPHSAANIGLPQVNPHMPAAVFHPFVHPELLMQNPFISYDLANMRGMQAMGHAPMQPLPADLMPANLMPAAGLSAARISPTLSHPSTSSPPSPATSEPTKWHHTSVESDEDDGQPIDVVKSAFVPILRPSPQNERIVDSAPFNHHAQLHVRAKSDRKAPSARKPVYRPAPRVRTPETRLKAPITTQKSVWRPY